MPKRAPAEEVREYRGHRIEIRQTKRKNNWRWIATVRYSDTAGHSLTREYTSALRKNIMHGPKQFIRSLEREAETSEFNRIRDWWLYDLQAEYTRT